MMKPDVIRGCDKACLDPSLPITASEFVTTLKLFISERGSHREEEDAAEPHGEAYALMKSKRGECIRVVNNTRVCSDCHTAAKYMSVVRKCDIFLKDGARFHHLREGQCTCNDCW